MHLCKRINRNLSSLPTMRKYDSRRPGHIMLEKQSPVSDFTIALFTMPSSHDIEDRAGNVNIYTIVTRRVSRYIAIAVINGKVNYLPCLS